MIDINLCMEMKEAVPSLEVEDRITKSLAVVVEKFLHKVN